ncbi:MAG: DUF2459 domain-containing protein [Caulobacterales bacterium]
MKPRRVSRGGGLAAVVIVLLIVIALATARGGDPALYPARPGEGVTLYLVDNGTHSDLTIPRAALTSHGGPAAKAAALTTADPWVMVGWGDARFYEGRGVSLDRAADGLRALFAPNNRSAVHLQGVDRRPDQAWPDGVQRLVISRAGLAALLTRLDRSFATDAAGAPIQSPTFHGPDEAFFHSGETFSLVHLCNHWTADLLSAAGVPTTPVLDTLPAGLWLDLRLRAGL